MGVITSTLSNRLLSSNRGIGLWFSCPLAALLKSTCGINDKLRSVTAKFNLNIGVYSHKKNDIRLVNRLGKFRHALQNFGSKKLLTSVNRFRFCSNMGVIPEIKNKGEVIEND